MKVDEMMSSLTWGRTANGEKVHIIRGYVGETRRIRAHCGMLVRITEPSPDTEVCSMCLKATEKYA